MSLIRSAGLGGHDLQGYGRAVLTQLPGSGVGELPPHHWRQSLIAEQKVPTGQLDLVDVCSL